MQEILQMLEEVNGKKGIQFTKSIQDYFNILSKRFRSNSKRTRFVYLLYD
jgi:hypothetical protein